MAQFDQAEPTANNGRRLPAIAKRLSRRNRSTLFTLPNGEVIEGYYSGIASTTDDTPTAITLDISEENSIILDNYSVYTFEVRAIGVQTDGAAATQGTGTAQSGTATTLVMASATSQADDFYNGMTITITAGTGEGQVRVVDDFTGASDTITVDEAWTTIPDATSVYAIKADLGAAVVRVLRGGISRGPTASSTALVGAVVDVLDDESGLSASTVAATADRADGSLVVTVTGEVAKDISWDVEISIQNLPYVLG